MQNVNFLCVSIFREGQLSRNSSNQEENFGRKTDKSVKIIPERGMELNPGLVDAGENLRSETESEKKGSFLREVFAEIPLHRSPNLLLRRNSKEATSTKTAQQQHPRPSNYGGGGDKNAAERDHKSGGSNRSDASESDSVLSNSMIDEVWAMDGVPLDSLCRDLLKSPVPSSSEMDELVAQNRNRFRDKKQEAYSQSDSHKINAIDDVVTKRMPSVASSTLKRKISKLKTSQTQNTDGKCESIVPVNSEIFAADSKMLRISAEQTSEKGSIGEDKEATKQSSDGGSNEFRSFADIKSTKTGLNINGYDTITIDHEHNKQPRDLQGLQHCPEISEEQNKTQKYHKNVLDTTANDSIKEPATETLSCPGSNKRDSHRTSQRKTVASLSVDFDGKTFSIGDSYDEVFDIDCISLPSCSSPPADEIERSRLRLSSPTNHVKTSTSNAEYHQTIPEPQHGQKSTVAANGVSSVKVDNTTRQGQGQGQGQEPKVKRRVDKANSACEDQDGNLREKEGKKKRVSESSQRSRSSDRTLRRSWIQVAKTVEIQLPRRSRSTSKTRKKSLNKEYEVVTVTTTTEETRTIPKLSPPAVRSASPGRDTGEGAKREADSHVTEKKFEIPEIKSSVAREILPISGVKSQLSIDENKTERQHLENFHRSSVEKHDADIHRKTSEPKDELERYAAKSEDKNSKTIVRLHLQNNHKCDDGLRVKVIEQHRETIEIQPNSGTHVEEMSVNDSAELHFQVSEIIEKENPGEKSGASFRRISTTKIPTQTRDEANELCNRVNELDSQMNGLAEELVIFGNIDSKENDAFTRNSASFDDNDDSRSLGGGIDVVQASQNTENVFSARQLNDGTIQKDDQRPGRYACTLIVSAIHAFDLPWQRRDSVVADKVTDSRNVSDIQTVRENTNKVSIATKENTNKVSIATKSREYCITAIDESQKIESGNETERSCEYNNLNSTSSDGRASKESHVVRDRDKSNRPEELTQIRRYQNGIQETRKVETGALRPVTGNFAKETVEFSETGKHKLNLKAGVDFSDDIHCEALRADDQTRNAERNRIHSSFIVTAQHRFDSNAKKKVKENFITTKTCHLTSNNEKAEIPARDSAKDTLNHGVLIEVPVEDVGFLRNDVFLTSTEEDLDSPECEREIARFVSEAINTACRKTMQVILSNGEGSSRSEEDSIGNRANHTSSSKFFDSIFIPSVAQRSNEETAANIRITGIDPVSCIDVTDNVNPGEMIMEEHHGSDFEVHHKCISESYLEISAASSGDVPEAAAAAAETEISLASQAEDVSDKSVNFGTVSRRPSSGHYSYFFKSIFRENSGDGRHTDYQNIPTNAASKDSGYDHEVLVDRKTQRTTSDVHEEESELDASEIELSVGTLSIDSTHGETCDNSVRTNSSKSKTVFPENKRSTASLTFVKSAEVNTRLVSQISTNTEEENRFEYRDSDFGPCTSSSSISYHMIVPIANTDEAQSKREHASAELSRTNPEKTYTTVLSKRVPVAKATVYFIGCEEKEKSRVLEISKDKIVTVDIDSVMGQDVGNSNANGGKQSTEISTFVMTSKNANKDEIDSCEGESLVPSNDSEISSETTEENTVETVEDSFPSNDNSITDFSALETYCGADSSIESFEEDSIEHCSGEVIQIYEQDLAEIQPMQSSDFVANNDDNVQENLNMLDYELRENIEIAKDMEGKSSPAALNICQETIDTNCTGFYGENETFDHSGSHNFDEETKKISNDVNCDVNLRYATELTDTLGENDDEQSYGEVTSFGDDVASTETQITVVNDDVIAANDWNLTEIARHSQDGQHQVITDDQLIAMEIHDIHGAEEKLDTSNADLQDSHELYETVKSGLYTDRLQARNLQEMYSEESNTAIKSNSDFNAIDLCTETGLEKLPSAQDGNQRIEELFAFEISEHDRDDVFPEEREGFDIRYFADENLTCNVDNVYTDELYETRSEYMSEQRRRDTEFSESNQVGSGENGQFSISWTVERKTEDSSEEKNDKESNSGSDWETEETGFTETTWRSIQYGFDSKVTESGKRGENEAATAKKEDADDDKPDDYMVTYEYGEMYSVFREVPSSIEGLRDSVLYNFNNSPSMKRLLARFPSLRPGTWKFASAVPEMEPDIRSTVPEVRIVEHLDTVSMATHFVPDLPNDEFFTL